MTKDAAIAMDVIEAYGHENVKALHRTTFEITKDDFLTPRGDCIIGIKASKAVADLNEDLKSLLRRDSTVVVIVLEAEGERDIVVAQGSSRLTLNDSRKIVVRKSTYISGDTLAIRANKAAYDLSRMLISKLRDSSARLRVAIIALDVDKLLRGVLDAKNIGVQWY